jgi:hypothetical protein
MVRNSRVRKPASPVRAARAVVAAGEDADATANAVSEAKTPKAQPQPQPRGSQSQTRRWLTSRTGAPTPLSAQTTEVVPTQRRHLIANAVSVAEGRAAVADAVAANGESAASGRRLPRLPIKRKTQPPPLPSQARHTLQVRTRSTQRRTLARKSHCRPQYSRCKPLWTLQHRPSCLSPGPKLRQSLPRHKRLHWLKSQRP